MYTIRVNDNCVIREYTTDTYFKRYRLIPRPSSQVQQGASVQS
jgi:hypothetical protein